MATTILLLGGYGNAGRPIARLLLQQTRDVRIILAGRNLQRAQLEAGRLNRESGSDRVTAQAVDLSDRASLPGVFQTADFILNAASTVPFTEHVAEALLESGKDYLDTQLSMQEKWEVLEGYAGRFAGRGICCITDGGFHPGIPGAMVRYAAGKLDILQKANVYSALKMDWSAFEVSPSTVDEMVEELKHFRMLFFRDGRWMKQPLTKAMYYDFGSPFGRQYVAPMFLQELEILSRQLPGLQETGFFVSGFNPLLDYVLLPVVVLGLNLFPRPMASPFVRLFLWGLRRGRPPYGIRLVGDCEGQKGEKPAGMTICLEHHDGYFMTAAPVVACLLQWLDGTIRQPGLWAQANLVEPTRFWQDLRQMGLAFEEKIWNK